MARGLVFEIQEYAIHDGPGIRSLVFLKGCPLRCKWCSNPEGQAFEAELMLHSSLCKACGACASACPYGAVTYEAGSPPEIDRRLCRSCCDGEGPCDKSPCLSSCPSGALGIAGVSVGVDEVMERLRPLKLFFDSSGGGLTLSGGEPFAQAGFIHSLAEACVEEGLSIGVETSADAPWDAIDPVLPMLDFVIIDLKGIDEKRHRDFTGRGNARILKNLASMATAMDPARIILSYTLIPGMTNEQEQFEKTIDLAFAHGLRNLRILPFHAYGAGKYEALGRNWPMGECNSMPCGELAEFQELARRKGWLLACGGS